MKSAALLSLTLLSTHLWGVSAGTNSVSLDAALQSVNMAGGTIDFDAGDVTVTNQVRAVQSDGTFTFVPSIDIIINGAGQSLNGGATTRGFFVGGSGANGTGSVTINNLTFSSCTARGGSSLRNGVPGGGGGGLGAGGGLFVGSNTHVTLVNTSFENCAVIGGNSALIGDGTEGSCGGGMRGNGISFGGPSGGGGGGFGGDGNANNTPGYGLGGGASGFANATGTLPGPNFDGGTVAGSPGVGGNSFALDGGYGGGGGADAGDGSAPSVFNGAGNFGGGGGIAGQLTALLDSSEFVSNGVLSVMGVDGAPGGFGGGGSSSSVLAPTMGTGGAGGFGAGGGSSQQGTSSSLFGGGSGDATGGGVGAGFGGAIFIQNSGNLTLSGTFALSNNTAIAGSIGHQNDSNYGSLGQDIFMMSSGQITFNLSHDFTMTSPIKSDLGFGGGSMTTGGLTKQGPYLLELVGENSYTGITQVEAGELRINGFVTSDIVVSHGATLSGDFTVDPNRTNSTLGDLTNHGTVSPGTNGVGKITVKGTYTQGADGNLVADITPTGNVNDKVIINAGGTASLDGTLTLIINDGNYIEGTQYVIVDGSSTGKFAEPIIKTGPQADNVLVEISYGSAIVTVLTNLLFTYEPVDPGPPTVVVETITALPIPVNSDFARVVEVLGTLSGPTLNKALTALSPVLLGTLEWINERNNSYIASLLGQHLFRLGCSPRDCQQKRGGFWLNVIGNGMNNHEQFDYLSPYLANTYGGLAGFDFCNSHFYGGLSVGYSNTAINWKNDLGHGTLNNYYGGAYGSYRRAHFDLDIALLGGGTQNDLHRELEFGTIDRTAKSNFWSYFASGHVGADTPWSWKRWTFSPFALADYHYYTRKGFTESGADSINLVVRSKSQNMMRGEAGAKVYYTAALDSGCYAPYVALSWVGEFPLESSHQKANFKGRPPVMDVEAYDSSAQLISPQAGVNITSSKGFSLIVGYKGLFNRKTSINQGEARLEWVF